MTNPLQRLAASLRRQGPAATAVKLWVLVADHFYDWAHGIDTCKTSTLKGLTIAGENRDRGCQYQVTRVLPLRKLFRVIKPMVPANSVLVDLGCGKGRVLFVASEFGFKEVRGVEFARELCVIARQNCARFKTASGDRAECRIIEADVTTYAFQKDESVFFMFNPFDEIILQKVLDNIQLSVEAEPRKILIIYFNPRAAKIIAQRTEYTRLQEFDFWGYTFQVYSNCG